MVGSTRPMVWTVSDFTRTSRLGLGTMATGLVVLLPIRLSIRRTRSLSTSSPASGGGGSSSISLSSPPHDGRHRSWRNRMNSPLRPRPASLCQPRRLPAGYFQNAKAILFQSVLASP